MAPGGTGRLPCIFGHPELVHRDAPYECSSDGPWDDLFASPRFVPRKRTFAASALTGVNPEAYNPIGFKSQFTASLSAGRRDPMDSVIDKLRSYVLTGLEVLSLLSRGLALVGEPSCAQSGLRGKWTYVESRQPREIRRTSTSHQPCRLARNRMVTRYGKKIQPLRVHVRSDAFAAMHHTPPA